MLDKLSCLLFYQRAQSINFGTLVPIFQYDTYQFLTIKILEVLQAT